MAEKKYWNEKQGRWEAIDDSGNTRVLDPSEVSNHPELESSTIPSPLPEATVPDQAGWEKLRDQLFNQFGRSSPQPQTFPMELGAPGTGLNQTLTPIKKGLSAIGDLAAYGNVTPETQAIGTVTPTPPALAPQKEVAPDQRLAPEPQQAPERISEAEATTGKPELKPEQKQKVNDYIRDKYFNRSQEAAKGVQGAFAGKQFNQSMANMQNLILAAGQAIGGAPAPKVGTEGSDAAIQAAMLNQTQVEKEEKEDAQSDISKHAQDFFKAVAPDIASKLPKLGDMSYSEIMGVAPWLEKSTDMDWKRTMQERIQGKVPKEIMAPVIESNNVLKELDKVEADITANPSNWGPIQGRIQNILRTLGVSTPAQGESIADTLYHTVSLLHRFGKTRAVATQGIYERLSKMAPENVLQSDTAKQIIQALRGHMKDEIRSNLEGAAANGAVIQPLVSTYLPGEQVQTLPGGGVKIGPAGQGGQGQAAPTPTPVAEVPPGKKRVIDPNGKPGFIPIEQWDAAKKAGYREG